MDLAVDSAVMGSSSYEGSCWEDYDDIDISMHECRCILHWVTVLRDSAACRYGGLYPIPDYGIGPELELAELELEKAAKLVNRLFEIDTKRRIDDP